MHHEGCILPFLANGRCHKCGQIKTLSIPNNIQVYVLKKKIEWNDLWDHLKINPFWRLFAISKPSNHSSTIENNTTLWLPFLNFKANGVGASMVAGEILPNDVPIFSVVRDPDRLYYKVEGHEEINAAVYSGKVPISRGLLFSLGLEPRSQTREDLLACEMEQLTINHQIPLFEIPTSLRAIDELGQEAIIHYTIDRFDQNVSICTMIHHGMTFSNVSLSLLLVPVHVGAIQVVADDIDKIRYAFLAVGAGKGIADIPVSPLRKKLWFIWFWFIFSTVLGLGIVIIFCIMLGFQKLPTLLICFGLMFLLSYSMRLTYTFLDRRIKIDLDYDQKTIDLFTSL